MLRRLRSEVALHDAARLAGLIRSLMDYDEVSTSHRTVVGRRICFAVVFADESQRVRRILSSPWRAGSVRRGLSDVSQDRVDTTETDCGLVGASRDRSCRPRLYPFDEPLVAARYEEINGAGKRPPDRNSRWDEFGTGSGCAQLKEDSVLRIH